MVAMLLVKVRVDVKTGTWLVKCVRGKLKGKLGADEYDDVDDDEEEEIAFEREGRMSSIYSIFLLLDATKIS